MRVIIFLVIIVFMGCTPVQGDKKAKQEKGSIKPTITDTVITIPLKKANSTLLIDSTEHLKYLNTRVKLIPYRFSSEVKRTNDSTIKLPFDVKERYGIASPDFGLLDFNKDGYDDLFFEYYGLSGTGEKNTVDIYFYESHQKKFTDSCFTMMNPSYFIDNSLITSYYYGNGGGKAKKHQISNGKLELIESIEIDINTSDGFEAIFRYSQKPFSDTLKFKDNMVRLPEEYKYRRIIKESNFVNSK